MINKKDLLAEDYVIKENVSNNLRNILKEWGFKFIMPPICEHHSVYENSRYKDQIVKFIFNNELIILRPDFTPSVSRMLNTLKFTNGKISYMGEVFREDRNEIVELTQCGAEFIGDEKEEDAIMLLIECIKKNSIKSLSIDMGHSSVYRWIEKKLDLDVESSENLNKIICSKSINDVTEYCNAKNVPESVERLIKSLCSVYGGDVQIDVALEVIDDESVKQDILHLKEIYENLKAKNENIHIDLGMVKDFDYYTGIIFEAFVDGASRSIASGGRYDNLINVDGENIKAVGFGINVDSLIKGMK